MQRKQGSPLSGSMTEARGFISGKICRGNYDSAVYMEQKIGAQGLPKCHGSTPCCSIIRRAVWGHGRRPRRFDSSMGKSVRIRCSPPFALSAKFTFVWFSQRLYWYLGERSGVSADLFFGRRVTAQMRLCCLYGVSIVPVKDYAWPLQVKCKS